jgi:hypothetical protein
MKLILEDFAKAIVDGERLTPLELVNLAISATTHASAQDTDNSALYSACRIPLYDIQDKLEAKANAGA